MKRTILTSIILIMVFGAACGPSPLVTPTMTSLSAIARPERLRVELPDSSDPTDLPRVLAVEALQAQGYTIEPSSLSETTLVTLALAQGDLDFAIVSNVDAWLAIQEGAQLVTVLDDTANTRYLISENEIKSCSDLNGQRIGVTNLKGTSSTLLLEYIKLNCPEINPQYLVISGSSNRMVSLQAGELDAALLDLNEHIELSNESNSNLHTLVNFADEFPGITVTSLIIRRALAEEYPETVKDIIRSFLMARRQLQDVDVLTAEIVKRNDIDPAEARKIAEIYIDGKLWDVNSRYTLDVIQSNIDFLAQTAGVKLRLNADDVADLSYLNAVLDEIGRQ